MQDYVSNVTQEDPGKCLLGDEISSAREAK